MRVLVFSRLFPNAAAPTAATFNVEQFRRLAERAQVQLIAPLGIREKIQSVLRGPHLRKNDTVAGIEVTYPTFYYTPGLLRSQHGLMLYRSVASTASRIISSFRPQVIYATWAYPDAYAASRLAARHKLPLVSKVHGSDVHSLAPQTREATRKALNSSHCVLSVSDDLRTRCADLGVDPQRLVTVYNGVDHSRFYPMDRAEARRRLGLDEQERIMLFVGNLLPVKRVHDIVGGFQAAQIPGSRLLLVGRGPQADELEQRTADDASISLLGPKPHDELPLYMNAADLVVLFSRREGVPNVLLEAMACGTPVVASSVGGIPEVVDRDICGEVVSRREDLPGALERTLLRQWDRGKIQQHAQQFSWDRNVEQLMSRLASAIRA